VRVHEDLVGEDAHFQSAAVEARLEPDGHEHDRCARLESADVLGGGLLMVLAVGEPIRDRGPQLGEAARLLGSGRLEGDLRLFEGSLGVLEVGGAAPGFTQRVARALEEIELVDEVATRV
jgi:hypothetical protein